MSKVEYGVERGKVFPASSARTLLNPLRRLLQSPKRLVAFMALAPDAYVLELGCGPGYFSPSLAQAIPNGQLVLFDLQHEMLAHARRRLTPGPGAVYAQGDAMSLPFRGSTYDAVLLVTVLGEVPDPATCVDELRRVVRPSGSVFVSETRRDSDFIPLPVLRATFEDGGLSFAGRAGNRWQYTARFVPASARRFPNGT